MARLLKRQQGSQGFLVGVTPAEAGWAYIHFEARRLKAGELLAGDTAGRETALILLGGRCTVTVGATSFASIGARESVWERRPPTCSCCRPVTATPCGRRRSCTWRWLPPRRRRGEPPG